MRGIFLSNTSLFANFCAACHKYYALQINTINFNIILWVVNERWNIFN